MENEGYLEQELIIDLNDIYEAFFVNRSLSCDEAYRRIQTAIKLHKVEVESQKQFIGVVLTNTNDGCMVFPLSR